MNICLNCSDEKKMCDRGCSSELNRRTFIHTYEKFEKLYPPRVRKCFHCGKVVTPKVARQYFCNNSCAAKWRRKNPKLSVIQWLDLLGVISLCKYCGNIISPLKYFCDLYHARQYDVAIEANPLLKCNEVLDDNGKSIRHRKSIITLFKSGRNPYGNKVGDRRSFPEIAFGDKLKSWGYEFIPQLCRTDPVWIYADFYLIDYDVFLEYDGSFHYDGLGNLRPEDIERDKLVLEHYGIRTIRIKDYIARRISKDEFDLWLNEIGVVRVSNG